MNKKHEVHPVASLFPMMDDVSFQALKEDIKTHGQLEPILYWKNMLVDGRNRLRACEELNIEPREVELMDETDPIAYVISHNLHRRHLTTGQRSDVAAKIATLRRGEVGNGRKVDGSKDTSISEAASQMKVSPASVKRAKKVHNKGSEAVKQAMADGTLPVSTAAALVDSVPDKEQQTKLIEDGVDTVRDTIKTIAKDDEIVFHDVDDEDDHPVAHVQKPDDVIEPEELANTISLKEAVRGAARRNSVDANYLAKKTGIAKAKIQAWLELSEELSSYKAVKRSDKSFAIQLQRIKSDKQFTKEVKSQSIHGDSTPLEHLASDLDAVSNKIEGILRTFGPECKDFKVFKQLDEADKRNFTLLFTNAMKKVAATFPFFIEWIKGDDVQASNEKSLRALDQ
jgi:ParB-like chromosome segregation protein Spo0J